MSRELTKMNLIAIVQQLPEEDIHTIETYIKMIEQENKILQEKFSIVSEMNVDSYNKYCEMIKKNNQLKEKNEYLKSKIENKDKWCQLIADIGYDYDGFNQVESLKALIDELVKYALYSRDNYDYEEWEKEGDNNG